MPLDLTGPAERISRPRARIKGTKVYADEIKMDAFTAGGAGKAAIPYDAAGHGRRALTWRANAGGPRSTLSGSLPTLRTRSRDAVRQNPFADMSVATLESNIVGTGIMPVFRTPSGALNDDLQELFADWTHEADADERCNWAGLQSLAARSIIEGGEVFVRNRPRRAGDMETVPLQIQLLESEFVPTDLTHSAANVLPPNQVIDGIQFNAIGRRTAYWMYQRHPADFTVNATTINTPRAVPAAVVHHMFTTRRPGQIRGEPWLTRGLIKLRDMDEYDDAELLRKKAAALIAGFITKPEDSGYEGTPDAKGFATEEWEGGALLELQPGEDVTFSDPTDVGSTYEVFNRQQLRSLATAAQVLYEQLSGDYSKVNDRTFRASVNEFRRRMEMLQGNLMISQFLWPFMMRWLAAAALSGEITVPRDFGRRDLFKLEWMTPGWAYINPVQEAQADKELIRSGLKSRAQAAGERGQDIREIDRQVAADNARADESGLVYDTDARKTSDAGLTQARAPGAELPPTEPRDEDEEGEGVEETEPAESTDDEESEDG